MDEEKLHLLFNRPLKGRKARIHGERGTAHLGIPFDLKAVVGVVAPVLFQVKFFVKKAGQVGKFHRWILPVPVE